MKRLTIMLLVLSLLIFTGMSSYAAEFPTTSARTVCNAAVTEAAFCTSSGLNLEAQYSKGTCHLTATGTAATSFTVSLYGSIDGVTYGLMTIDTDGTPTTATYTVALPATNTFSVTNQSVKYIKGYYVSKVGGDATSAITMSCAFGGN